MRHIDIRDINETETAYTAPVADTFEQRLDRVTANAQTARTAGFTLKETVFEAGTAVNDIGVENAKKSRADFEKLPLLADGLTDFERTIAAEKRHHLVTEVSTLRLSVENGFRLGVQTVKNTAALTRGAAMQLADYIDVPGRVMSWLYSNGGVESEALLQCQVINAAGAKVKVRGRALATGEGREVFAILSEKYPIVDAAPTLSREVAAALLDTPGARVDIQYNRETLTTIFDVQFHSNIDAGNYACGELFRAGVRITTNDAGAGSAVVQAFVVRNLCLNLIILDTAAIEFDRVIHVGSVESRLARIQAALGKAQEAIGTFASAWASADRTIGTPKELDAKVRKNAKTKVETKGWIDATPEERVLGLVRGEVAKGRLLVNEDQAQAIATAYWKDSMTATNDVTYQGWVNALSRAAHEGMDRWSGAALEQAAGYYAYNQPQLNYQYVAIAG